MMELIRILIADDEPIIRMDLREMLESKGYQVTEASDGKKALALLLEEQFDLAILDINMPKISGLEVIQNISKSKEIPIILLTAYCQNEVVTSALEMGVFGYLVKPVREEQLFPSIQLALAQFKSLLNLKDQQSDLKNKIQEKGIIKKASAILQEKYGMNEKIAYEKMRKYSMEKRVTLEEVAKEIIKNST